MQQIPWTLFKQFVSSRGLSIQYFDLGESYWLKAFDGLFELECNLPKNAEEPGEEQLDFENNFKANGNKSLWQSDADGAQIVRQKAAKKGWTYYAIPLEFKTSEIGSLYSKNLNGTDRAGLSLKFYNAAGTEITQEGLAEINETTIVRTVVDFEPAYDYEVIGGNLQIEQDITSLQNCRLWIVAVPDIPANQGGSKEMVGGINLRFLAPQNNLEVDGRVAKFLQYNATYHTNKLRFVLEHTAGLKIWVQLVIELYRE